MSQSNNHILLRDRRSAWRQFLSQEMQRVAFSVDTNLLLKCFLTHHIALVAGKESIALFSGLIHKGTAQHGIDTPLRVIQVRLPRRLIKRCFYDVRFVNSSFWRNPLRQTEAIADDRVVWLIFISCNENPGFWSRQKVFDQGKRHALAGVHILLQGMNCLKHLVGQLLHSYYDNSHGVFFLPSVAAH